MTNIPLEDLSREGLECRCEQAERKFQRLAEAARALTENQVAVDVLAEYDPQIARNIAKALK